MPHPLLPRLAALAALAFCSACPALAQEDGADPELGGGPSSELQDPAQAPAMDSSAQRPGRTSLPKATLVIASKREGSLRAYAGSLLIFEARAGFGSAEGDKTRRGDARTPEGVYALDYKKTASRYYKSIHVGYPRADQRAKAAARGIDPGDEILVHGPEIGPDGKPGATMRTTEGCVALSADDMDALWAIVEPGIPILIEPL